jgi:hypothetical protein
MARELRINGATLRLVLPEDMQRGDALPADYTERLAAILAPAGVCCDLGDASHEPDGGFRSRLTGAVFAFALADETGPGEDGAEPAAPVIDAIQDLLIRFFVESDWSSAVAEIVST